ncbi:L-threonate dehydrogenase [Azospirillum canadense]|uniref:L-threonate dehydrogenase n=1 Tax=Azospirillum canadense TaxID=403962 RepID=UPI002227EC50|nr:L-threonate dehydrogenase [Azospirillum canadense]MCW2237216.1 3-hydroxyisobutyrate dehydrogenase [Azospirillum canadense]
MSDHHRDDHIRARVAGVIGLGSMGMGVALSLLRGGFRVIGCDEAPAKCMSLVTHGGEAAATPAELGRQVERVVILVATADQVESVLFGPNGIAATLPKGGCVVQSATVPAAYAADAGRRLADLGLLMLDAPVSGGPVKAAEGRMTVMASGPEEAFARAEDLLAAASGTLHRVGTEHGQGSVVKTINQLLAGVHIAASAEAMAFGIRAGVDPQRIYDVITSSAGNSWMFENRVPHILNGDYSPHSAVDIFVKDLGIVVDSARRMTFPTPLAATALQMFTMAASAGLGREDDAAVIKIFERLAGITLPQPNDNPEG